MTNKYIFLLLGGLLSAICAFQKGIPPVGETGGLDAKVDSLLALMTLDEKIGQMTLFTSDWDVTGPTLREGYKDDIRAGKTGAIFNAHTAAYNHELQRIAVEETRLGIPLLFGYDVIHGYKTIFPVSLGEAASWDMEAIEKSARVAAEEATAAGLHWTFAPMVDIARDPRWGRISEGAGEDVFYGKKVAAARVKGFQGGDLSAANTLLACAKHYAAYGAVQAGRDYHTVDISERVLRETYLPPFKAAVDAGVGSFMTSFNELNGVPATGNKHLLTDILRNEWHFKGFVVTDYTSINEMVPHGIAADEKAAGELALKAGVDMDMQGAVFYNFLKKSIAEGKVSVEQVDVAVRRILKIKYELGLFDDPYRYGDPELEKKVILSAAHLEAARDVARKSFVLLKNQDRTLPLSKGLKTVAVIGPLADSKKDLLGSWHAAGNAEDCVTLLAGLREKLGAASTVLFAEGCKTLGRSKDGFAEAVNAAKRADAVILAVGETRGLSGEAASRSMIGLPGVQLDLVKELVAICRQADKPLAVVLMNGRPLAIPWLAENAPAILETWFAGTQGGHAIADVLFGDYNPSGKLPATFPRNVGQVPIYYCMKNTGRPMDPKNKYTSKYLDVPNSPQFPFGFGLSYTSFDYSPVLVDKTVFGRNDKLKVSVRVTNSGSYDGEEVVQLYVRDLVGSVTRPVRELKGFEKIFLKKGETREVEFTLRAEDLAFYTRDMSFKAEAGDFEIFVGGNSDAENSAKVELR
ncbi:MAG TPA: glycosyl hydrolase [Bacteroidetes bacterium]|nr:glycosyl hydrolase [Bacteroidota bacterium]